MLLQHGCSWSSDHHTSVKQTTVQEKNKIDDLIHAKKDTAIFSRVLLQLFSGLKILVENRSLYDKCV